jgi:hypothetical protein
MNTDEERPHTERVASEDKTPPIRVPECDGPLTIEATERIGAPLFVGVNDDFRVAARAEPMSALFEFVPQLNVVEDLSVERNPE